MLHDGAHGLHFVFIFGEVNVFLYPGDDFIGTGLLGCDFTLDRGLVRGQALGEAVLTVRSGTVEARRKIVVKD